MKRDFNLISLNQPFHIRMFPKLCCLAKCHPIRPFIVSTFLVTMCTSEQSIQLNFLRSFCPFPNLARIARAFNITQDDVYTNILSISHESSVFEESVKKRFVTTNVDGNWRGITDPELQAMTLSNRGFVCRTTSNSVLRLKQTATSSNLR